MEIKTTAGELLKLYKETEDGLAVPGCRVYDVPQDGPVRYPCEIQHIDYDEEDSSLYFYTDEYEGEANLDDELVLLIYKEIDSLDEV